MLPHSRISNRPGLLLTSVLALLSVFALTPAVGAQESGAVDVTGAVGTSLSPLQMTLCDSGANFGTNLDSAGTTSNSSDNILSIPGNASINQGSFYKWTPACASGTSFITVNSTISWTGSVCSTENGGSGASSLALADRDLRFSIGSYGSTSYNSVDSAALDFAVCGVGSTDWTSLNCTPGYTVSCGTAGISNHRFYYYLQVDREETVGTFASTTTWSVSG